jgi:hypothetical protein
MRHLLIAVCTIGLSFTGLSFIVRLFDYSNLSGGMFWFEPFLRSGVYALSFGFALTAHRGFKFKPIPEQPAQTRIKEAEQDAT